MTSFLLQVWTIFQQGYVQMYFLFFIVVNIFFWLRVYIASKNKTYTDEYSGKIAVIVPVFRESKEIFEKCLSSIKKYGKPVQLIVTIDDAGHASEEVKKIAREYADNVLEMSARVGKREQFYIASQHLKKDLDIVMTVDSDTYWDESTMEMIKPFKNEKVGAVSGRQTIFDYKKHLYVALLNGWKIYALGLSCHSKVTLGRSTLSRVELWPYEANSFVK